MERYKEPGFWKELGSIAALALFLALLMVAFS